MPSCPLILASGSPRRQELLLEAGYAFEVVVPSPSAECGVCSGETPPELVARMAHQKARDVAAHIDQGLILACDTVAECRGRILGKPVDLEHARQMLVLLRGQRHHVYSGLCLWRRPDDRVAVAIERTTLRMDPVSDDLLDIYLASEQWMGKAGAFGYQDGYDWLHILEGSESNVVGLPLERLAELLTQFDEPH